MTRIYYILALLLTLCSCSEKDYFVVSGELEGLGAQTVSISYYADGGIKTDKVTANGNKFAIRGSSIVPTLCIVEASGFGEMATVVVSNGEKITLKGTVTAPLEIEVSGNSTSSKVAEWTAANVNALKADNATAINNSIREYVNENRGELASTVLMVTHFHVPGFELEADSLLSIIETEAKPMSIIQNFNSLLSSQLTKGETREVRSMLLWTSENKVQNFNPSAHSLVLLAFRNPGKSNDSVANLLRELSEKYTRQRLNVVELSTAKDTLQWQKSLDSDTVKWVQAWAPGAVAMSEVERLKVPRLPFFIVADSTGRQLLRTSSVKAVRKNITDTVNRYINKKVSAKPEAPKKENNQDKK